MTQVIKLKVDSVEEFRNSLHISGLFDLLDCELEIGCYAEAPIEDIDLIRAITEAAINVVDVRITASHLIEGYDIKITEVPVSVVEGKKKK